MFFTVLLLCLTVLVSPVFAAGQKEASAPAVNMTVGEDGIAWRQFAGTTLRLGMNKHAYTETIRKVLPEFEEKTGIKVVVEDYAQDEFMSKRLVDLSSGAGTYDLVMMDSVCTQAAQAGWIENLEPWFQRRDLVDLESYDLDDLAPSWKLAFTYQDDLYAIPVSGEKQMLFYRTDLFKEHGIKVPETFDEVYAAAEYFKKIMPAGILVRGQKIHTVSNCTGVIWSYGGKIADSLDYNYAVFNTPEAVAGADMYTSLARNFGPAGIENYTWYECVSDFQQGKAPMFLDMSVFMSQLEDPEASTVSGKIGYAPMPAGPAGSRPTGGAWAMSMSASSKNKDAAWLLLSWLTCPETSRKLAAISGVASRVSALSSDEIKTTFPEDWLTALQAGLAAEVEETTFPTISRNEEYLDTIGTAFNSLIQKEQDVQKVLDDAVVKVTRLFELEKK
jgi:ABC-type glycerol-3-phosphate transport system substrate-binding protein